MGRLYVRVAFGVGMAVLAGSLVAAVLVPPMPGLFEQGMQGDILGNLLWIGGRIDTLPPGQWASELVQAQQRVRLPLRIEAVDSLPPQAASQVSRERPTLVRAARDAPSIYIPVHGGSHVIVAGPLPRPPIRPRLIPALGFVLVLTVTASAVVGRPLMRQLRRFAHVLGELGGGNWGLRLDASAEGALRELAESINRMAAQLQVQFQERETLLQTVSHEIGTPLASMRLQVELLAEELSTTPCSNRLEVLAADLDELDDLSTELVAWMTTDARTHKKQEFALGPVLESLVEQETARTHGRLKIELLPSAELILDADQRQFRRAMLNLLRNAVRHAQELVVVEAKGEQAFLVIEIRDDGHGFVPQQRLKIFEAFVRLEEARSPSNHGLGLGLAVVRRIVESHGGSVAILAAPEGGTRVHMRWPRSNKTRFNS